MSVSRLRAINARLDRWFRDHVAIWWLLLATIPGGVYAGTELLLDGGSPLRALILGSVFGVTFATITVGVQRWWRG